ncbi:MAG: 50S ribosomal protein L21e [Candidatus Diapherotrites archaeon]|uniref:Large ribosomal subunit protein eL21 n=1 Tax=Candidatus Iainarchaeum sp. TaxID=3101447 RepID=A0A2D6M0Z5_9ARCH|nr:50S ribosomal protein L21e [Candidatus Diapherotrites archaeon]|tara:strand:- start:3281 stop:3577 length:297 start_codon:yes stop_codon:yes gene_type:complete
MTNKKARGKRSKTRRKLRARDKKTVNQLVRVFAEKDNVRVRIDSSIHAGMPSAKYNGFGGKVVGTRGSAFEVAVKDGNIPRVLIVHPAHLQSLGGGKS